jgi:hypothetical protein
VSEASPEDRLEQGQTPTRDSERATAPAVPLEAPDADAVEQATSAGPDEHLADEGGDAGSTPLETDPADRAEQSMVVELDEDEGRS